MSKESVAAEQLGEPVLAGAVVASSGTSLAVGVQSPAGPLGGVIGAAGEAAL